MVAHVGGHWLAEPWGIFWVAAQCHQFSVAKVYPEGIAFEFVNILADFWGTGKVKMFPAFGADLVFVRELQPDFAGVVRKNIPAVGDVMTQCPVEVE